MKILISNKAFDNLNDIFKFNSQISFQYANKLISSIYSKIESLEKFPYSGRKVPELNISHYREKICNNYRIIYDISEIEQIIYIKQIICCRQNPDIFLNLYKKDLNKFTDLF